VETGKVLEFCNCLDRHVWVLSHLFLFGMCADFSTIRFTDQPSNMGGVEGSVNVLRLAQPRCDYRRKIKSAGSLRKYWYTGSLS